MSLVDDIAATVKSCCPPESAYTHCMDLISETLLRESEHFKRTDIQSMPDGFLVTYDCLIDGRTYDVFVKARK